MKKSNILSRVSALVLVIALAMSTFVVSVGAAEVHPGLLALDELLTQFPMEVTNDNAILQPGDPGNTLRWMNPSNNTFPGLFQHVLSSEAMDSEIMTLQTSAFVTSDASWMYTDDGIAILRFDNENNAVELTMQHEVYWHDGVQLTLDDLVFAYELMAHPDYTGIRYVASSYVPWVLGIAEYREGAEDGWKTGTADHISGLVLSEDKMSLRIYYDRALPPAAQYIGNLWLTPIPRHHLEPAIAEVGVGELNTHARARHEALGYGPWIIESIVPGESVLFKANEDYYRGRPLIDQILWQIVPNDIFMAAMREGQFDVSGMGTQFYEEHMLHGARNYQLLGQPATGNGFMYIRTGTMEMCEDAGVPIATPREEGWHPVQDVNIRRAIFHAMPQQLISDTINNGLGVPAGTIMHPHNARAFIHADIPMYYFDLEKAKEILDENGYAARGANGYRLDLEGRPMHFIFSVNENTFNREAVPIYLQMWREIGLDVRLYTDDLVPWATYLDNLLLTDNWSDEVHMFISNWSLGANPAPHGLWSVDNSFNMPRHNTEEYRQILDDISSPEAFDAEFLADAYYRWQMYMYENAVANQMFWNVALTMVNNRVANYSLVRESGLNGVLQRTHTWGLTAPQPYAHTR